MLEEIYDECQQKMEKSISHMKSDFKSLRTGKVLVSILDNVMVEYYGTPTPLAQVATILATDATTITVSPWEKHLLSDVESAIARANIGVNPNNDGEQVKLFFPPMTVEQRQDTVKQMMKMGENAKVSIRNDRKKANDAVKKLEKDKEITTDESKAAQDQVQKYTDKAIASVEEILKTKEQDILTV
ncbi:MAG: ribosome recycling factor [Campylobacterota bacterium]|nr:ribosome recycling factor [Campylobacterota bacterium]